MVLVDPELVAEFEKKLKTKKSLFYEINQRKPDNIKDTLTSLIINLNNKGFNFTRVHFDKFLDQAIAMKSKCYLLKYKTIISYNINNIYQYDKIKNKCISLMFSKFTPTSIQFSEIINCYKNRKYKASYLWLDTLLENGFKPTNEQIKMIENIGYNLTKIFKDNITITQLETIVKNLEINDNIEDILTLFKNNDIKVTEKTMINFLENVKFKKNNYYVKHEKQITNFNVILNLFFNNGCPINDVYIELLLNSDINNHPKKKEYMESYMLLIEKGCKPTKKSLLLSIDTNELDKFILFVKNGAKLDNEVLNKLIVTRSLFGKRILYNLDSKVSDELDSKYSIKKSYIDLVGFILDQGVKPDLTSLRLISKHNFFHNFKKITEIFKIYPDYQCLINSFCNSFNKNKLILEILNYKFIVNNDVFNALCSCNNLKSIDIKSRLEILIKFGFIIDLDNIRFSISNGKLEVLDYIDQFNIPWDKELYYILHRYQTFPGDYISKFSNNIDQNILVLRDMCRSKRATLDKLKEFINKSNIKPDRYCMENAALNNPTIFEYFINDLDLEPTMTCLSLISSSIKQKERLRIKILEKLEKKYGSEKEIMDKPY